MLAFFFSKKCPMHYAYQSYKLQTLLFTLHPAKSRHTIVTFHC